MIAVLRIRRPFGRAARRRPADAPVAVAVAGSGRRAVGFGLRDLHGAARDAAEQPGMGGWCAVGPARLGIVGWVVQSAASDELASGLQRRVRSSVGQPRGEVSRHAICGLARDGRGDEERGVGSRWRGPDAKLLARAKASLELGRNRAPKGLRSALVTLAYCHGYRRRRQSSPREHVTGQSILQVNCSRFPVHVMLLQPRVPLYSKIKILPGGSLVQYFLKSFQVCQSSDLPHFGNVSQICEAEETLQDSDASLKADLLIFLSSQSHRPDLPPFPLWRLASNRFSSTAFSCCPVFHRSCCNSQTF